MNVGNTHLILHLFEDLETMFFILEVGQTSIGSDDKD